MQDRCQAQSSCHVWRMGEVQLPKSSKDPLHNKLSTACSAGMLPAHLELGGEHAAHAAGEDERGDSGQHHQAEVPAPNERHNLQCVGSDGQQDCFAAVQDQQYAGCTRGSVQGCSNQVQHPAYHATHEAGQALHEAAQLVRDGLLHEQQTL